MHNTLSKQLSSSICSGLGQIQFSKWTKLFSHAAQQPFLAGCCEVFLGNHFDLMGRSTPGLGLKSCFKFVANTLHPQPSTTSPLTQAIPKLCLFQCNYKALTLRAQGEPMEEDVSTTKQKECNFPRAKSMR